MRLSTKKEMRQVVYNYLDINGSGAVINNPTDCDIFTPKTNTITTDIGDTSYISKIGVQAPPGTIFYLGIDSASRNKDLTQGGANVVTITGGRNGIYELEDPDIRIYAVQFKKPTVDDGQDPQMLEYAKTSWEKLQTQLKNFESNDTTTAFLKADFSDMNFDPANKYIQVLIDFIVINKSLLTDYQGILNQLYRIKESNATRNIIVDYIIEGSV